ncbi:MAG TPA: hypothetical protein VNM14_02965 [Planctomycetota bacterium]|nr:hypothetical protein [Planctomycetota bacterium]
MNDGFFERRMAGVVDRLTRAGYSDTFRGEAGGVRALKADHVHRPEDLEIDSIDRFEGISDPQDEAIVLALHSRTDGCRGTYTLPYGKNMPSVDGELLKRIPDGRNRE